MQPPLGHVPVVAGDAVLYALRQLLPPFGRQDVQVMPKVLWQHTEEDSSDSMLQESLKCSLKKLVVQLQVQKGLQMSALLYVQ